MAEGATIDRTGLQALIDVLAGRGYTVVGPTPRDGALVLAEVSTVADLPHGLGDVQAPGSYRLRERDDDQLFGFAATAQSAKPWLFPPRPCSGGARAPRRASPSSSPPGGPTRPSPCWASGRATWPPWASTTRC